MISIPGKIQHLMKKLTDAGFESYIVGGCVRDQILGRKVKDFDVTTSATPDEVKQVFKDYKIISYGAVHGTQVVRYKGENVEITTFRVEGRYSDGRRPDSVSFVRNLEEDLSRRDFTINAIAVDTNGHLHDPFSGAQDLKNGIIRTVGDPSERFAEDSLRIFRACRFALRYKFIINLTTIAGIKDSVHLINKHAISGERIFAEMLEILQHGPAAFKLLKEFNLLEILFDPNFEINDILILNALEKAETSDWFVNLSIILRGFQPYTPKDCYKLISRLAGMSKYDEACLVALLLNGSLDEDFEQSYSMVRYLRFYQQLVREIFKKKKYNRSFFINQVIAYNRAFLDFQDEILRVNLIKSDELLNLVPPVDGNDMKAIGCQGKQISGGLWLAASLFQKDQRLDKNALIKVVIEALEGIFNLDLFIDLYYNELNGKIEEGEVHQDLGFARRVYQGQKIMVLVDNDTFELLNLHDKGFEIKEK